MIEKVYKKDKKGVERVWIIKVTDNVIEIEHGIVSGEKINTREVIESGKNIGRSNETTPHEQALLEAKSRLKKKKDAGYGSELNPSDKNLSPMLAHDFSKHSKSIKFPVYTQPKLDGYRMIYNGKIDVLLSRTGKEYEILVDTPLHTELRKFKDVILDGELYIHDKTFAFESYGILRKKKLNPGENKILNSIEYHVYDIISDDPFSIRTEILKNIIKNTSNIKLVDTVLCKNMECVKKFNEQSVENGYEGSMVRVPNSLYCSSRTKDLLKYKTFDDAEFKVIDFEKETDTKGDKATPVVWVCQTTDGKKFKVPSKGTREERTKLFKQGDKYIGKMLTVQFFGYSKEGIPRFPKTLREGKSSFRED